MGGSIYARWASFAIGLGLTFAPLVLGYQEVGPTLHDVLLGLLVCILCIAALETPALRFLSVLPAGWLVISSRLSVDSSVGFTELCGGLLLIVATLVPRAWLGSRIDGTARGRAGMRA